MRVSIITEGVSEYSSLPLIRDQLRSRTGSVISTPLKVNVAPDAPPIVVARECKSRVLIARASQRANLILVLLDREQQEQSCGAIATSIREALGRTCGGASDIAVVVKDRLFENWLIADLDALRSQPRRFSVTPAMQRAVEPNRADRAPAMALMKRAVNGDYDKVKDSARILERMNVGSAAQHSRSFRHFLHVLGDSQYSTQCREPA